MTKFIKSGYATITSPQGVKEYDTCTCKHCNAVWTIRSTEKGQGDPGGWCTICARPICPNCVGKECFPLERRLELYEKSEKLFRDMGLEL